MNRQDKSKATAKGVEQSAVGYGGAATSAGILFQQQVGAIISSLLLAERTLDQRLNLGQAQPAWIRFETEAPVDDILVGTSDGGIVAFQVKTKVSLSKDLDSQFGKTVSQFVRHWLACRDGDGTLNWNRPLDPQVDRLVLAVGPNAPTTVRVVLPTALRLKSQPGGGQLNANQQRAFSQFETCVQEAWSKATNDAYSPDVARNLAALISVLTFDPGGSAREAAIGTLRGVGQEPSDASGIFSGLETVCAEMMAGRGGVDRQTVRQKLLGRGIKLLPPQDFRTDITQLKDHSKKIAKTLERYEAIEAVDGEPIRIVRECQDAIRNAASEGSLLIVGEPGAGKSGVLNALARDLRDNGSDVLELAVDRYSVETLEGLKSELRLEHGLIETLEAWDGIEPAWLVIDGLDASRGGPSGRVFRSLIERVMSHDGRWNVIASIRTFDLRMGQLFQGLFKGTPPNKELTEQEFPNVRHVQVPPWTPTEFAQLLDKAPSLAGVMANSSQDLQDVAAVPFNTRLLSDLVKDGLVTADLSHVASQAELLQLYWKHRIETHGAPAQACILRVVRSMVKTRVLRAPFEIAAEKDAAVLDVLESAGVLISDGKRRGIQFRHHLLFDFAAARVLLDPEALIAGRQKFSKADARGLMLAPALSFVLQEIWMRETSRAEFWTAAAQVLSDNEGDPVIRSATGRICAEYPVLHDDMIVLAKRIVANDKNAAQAFAHMSGALGIRLEDHPEMPLAPWTGMVRDIAPNVASVDGAVRFLLFRLVGRVNEQSELSDLGTAARALLAHAFSLDSSGNLVPTAIDLVCDTYATDAPESRTLLEKVFAPDRLAVHAAEEVPALCRKIDTIAEFDPEFGARIYRETYGFQINDARETKMSDSQIMPFRSNARQDYGMARYSLKKNFGKFLELHPDHAIDAIVQAVGDYVERDRSQTSEMIDAEFQVDGRPVRLREDRSHIWASDPESRHSDDARALINVLLKHLRSADAANAIRIAERLVETSNLAVFWSRLFLAAGERRDELLDFCMPIAMRQEFLTLQDTVKDAVDVVAKGYGCLSLSAREAFETNVSQFDFSRLSRPNEARASIECRLFGEIGEANLATDHARAVAKGLVNVKDVKNERPFAVRISGGSLGPYHWIRGHERDLPANRNLMDAIDRAKCALALKADARNGSNITLEVSLGEMEALVTDIDGATQDPGLVIHAEGQISSCISRLVERKQVPDIDDDATTVRFLKLFNVAVTSAGPTLQEDTEENFERNASWGSPAPRVDAAKAALELARQRPDLYSSLEHTIDNLLRDPHPAVRLEAALYLVSIWDIDRAGFWRRLSDRLSDEPNANIIDHVCAGVLGRTVHVDAERTEQLALELLGRFQRESERQVSRRKSVSDFIAVLWVTYERQASRELLKSWIADAANHSLELSKILVTLRTAFVAGLTGAPEPGDAGLRHRSQEIAHDIVAAANAGLESHFRNNEPSAEQEETGRNCALLIDEVCLQLYFAAKIVRNGSNSDSPPSNRELAVFFDEVRDTLEAIGNFATPHTVHYLLQLFEFLVPVNSARAFDLTMHAVLSGGQRTGYQFESLGVDLLVKLVGLFLADHNELFEDEDRRSALIDCLGLFMDAGWPVAQRLLYRLPELIQ